MSQPLLQIDNATKIYTKGLMKNKQEVIALQDFNLNIDEKPATITTIAGESGSGKTTLANAVLGFISLTSGKIIFKGTDISTLDKEQFTQYRRQVQPVFQDPYEVYNPYYPVRHIFDVVIKNFNLSDNRQDAYEIIVDALRVVGLRAEEILEKYPHQLSGGQRQRMMMARAYLLKPDLIVADEPVSMVDSSLRSMILDTMLRLRDGHNISFIYITHDLSTAYQISDSIFILYQGAIAEGGNTDAVIENPQHPYVKLLIESIPEPDPRRKWDTLVNLMGEDIRHLQNLDGCSFYPRCSYHMDRCLTTPPRLIQLGDVDHRVACYLYD